MQKKSFFTLRYWIVANVLVIKLQVLNLVSLCVSNNKRVYKNQTRIEYLLLVAQINFFFLVYIHTASQTNKQAKLEQRLPLTGITSWMGKKYDQVMVVQPLYCGRPVLKCIHKYRGLPSKHCVCVFVVIRFGLLCANSYKRFTIFILGIDKRDCLMICWNETTAQN